MKDPITLGPCLRCPSFFGAGGWYLKTCETISGPAIGSIDPA